MNKEYIKKIKEINRSQKEKLRLDAEAAEANYQATLTQKRIDKLIWERNCLLQAFNESILKDNK